MSEVTKHSPARADPSRARATLAAIHPPGEPGAVIYGMIVASVAITVQAHLDAGYPVVFTATTLTAVVYWLTHVYCHAVARSLSDGRRLPRARILAVLRDELPILAGAATQLAAVAVASVLGFDLRTADWVSIGVTIVLLFVWGLAAGARAGAPWRVMIVDAGLGAGLGALLALFRLVLPH